MYVGNPILLVVLDNDYLCKPKLQTITEDIIQVSSLSKSSSSLVTHSSLHSWLALLWFISRLRFLMFLSNISSKIAVRDICRGGLLICVALRFSCLAQLAAKFSEWEVRQVRPVFRRDKAERVLKEWIQHAVFFFHQVHQNGLVTTVSLFKKLFSACTWLSSQPTLDTVNN